MNIEVYAEVCESIALAFLRAMTFTGEDWWANQYKAWKGCKQICIARGDGDAQKEWSSFQRLYPTYLQKMNGHAQFKTLEETLNGLFKRVNLHFAFAKDKRKKDEALTMLFFLNVLLHRSITYPNNSLAGIRSQREVIGMFDYLDSIMCQQPLPQTVAVEDKSAEVLASIAESVDSQETSISQPPARVPEGDQAAASTPTTTTATPAHVFTFGMNKQPVESCGDIWECSKRQKVSPYFEAKMELQELLQETGGDEEVKAIKLSLFKKYYL